MITRFAARSFVVLWLCANSPASFSDPIIYPGTGQSAQQMDKDKYECYGWAKSNSGYDPTATPAPAVAPPAAEFKRSGGVVRGAAGGAALGAIVGDNSEAAGRGAAAGAVVGGLRQRAAHQQQVQMQQQQPTHGSAASANYDRAYAACLEGRGYTVK